jgi:hypothetical protein
MLNMMKVYGGIKSRQHGVALVEFAIVACLLFILLFGIFEFGRIFYVINTVQEVTRRAAREAVVNWYTNESDIKSLALFGGNTLPAGAEIGSAKIKIEYLNSSGAGLTSGNGLAPNIEQNIVACTIDDDDEYEYDCIQFVRVSIEGATYEPMIGLFSGIEYAGIPFSKDNPFKIDLKIPIPPSTVIMPAESLGYLGLV